MSEDVLQLAEKFCDEHKLRFTDTRQYVLDIVASAKKPITAYEILDALGGKVKNPKPPIVYRATDFWQSHGFIHKIESLNAFVTCQEGHQHHGSQFMICDTCGKASEIHLCHIPESIAKKADQVQFDVLYWNLELHGRCQACCG